MAKKKKAAIGFFLLVVFANVITTFWQCGLGPCEDVPWPTKPSATESISKI